MTVILLFLAFVFGVALVMGLFIGGSKLPGMLLRRKLDARLLEVTQAAEANPDAGKVLVKVRHEGMVPGLDRVLGGTTRGSAIGRWIEQSGVKTSISSMLIIAAVVAMPLALLVGAATRAPWGLPLGGGNRLLHSVHRLEGQARTAAAHVRGAVPRGARPDLAGAEGRTRVRDRTEDGGRRDAGAGRARIQKDLRRTELRSAAEGRAREPHATGFPSWTCGSSRPRC